MAVLGSINEALLSRDLSFLPIMQRLRLARNMEGSLFWLKRKGKIEQRDFMEGIVSRMLQVLSGVVVSFH